ncbi:pollen-specific leucine-rich repeat extensin-like protein 3 [Phtheirospermum japonicum]|uniref:Cell wall hydroxyproline-rich glycoprotein n=1 Tax=Phtheirospermum japonicum TaxID=374723 RepID=A0A830BGH7_9LAMI|nr:pollen-specific leucine-rich repeat extensin-like protein 3 [Phtheirospermum japonicum]
MASSHPPASLLIRATFLFLIIHITAKNRHTTTTNHHHATIHRLKEAHAALQAWKLVIYSDPLNFTANWHGPNVCNYSGIYCAPHPNDTSVLVVAGIDLNHCDIAGYLPDELGLLSDLALLHLNSNRFCGILPKTLTNLSLLFELDLSNNRFVGPFPSVILSLPSLRYVDLRFNEFEGVLPPQLFSKPLDAIFVNNNRFSSVIPQNLGSSTASVVVFANNRFNGCLSPSIAKFANTLEELLLTNTSITGCLPIEVGFLYKLRVLDVSFNQIVGPVPYSLAGLSKLEVLNLGHNKFSGIVPEGICVLPSLANFTFSYNFFCEEQGVCGNLTSKGIVFDDRRNCLPEKKLQRSVKECEAVKPVDCFENECSKSTYSHHIPLSSTSSPP